jgi:cardiolipin synthase C
MSLPGAIAQAMHAAGARPDQSGVYALRSPREAFAARVLLARAAERSLDVQYYIWHDDTTGNLLLEELWNAAGRGVRVRLLLDDNGIAGLDPTIAAFDTHAHVEVRLFNPFPNRRHKTLGYLTDFQRLNRRMHNKSFTADSAATIVGGRNVGDEYFGAGQRMIFEDLDVVAVGSIAREVEAAFDQYWNSDSARPAADVIGQAPPEGVSAMRARFAEVRASTDAVKYVEAVRATHLVEALLAHTLEVDWTRVRLVCDPPAKVDGHVPDANLLFTNLRDALGKPEREIDIISPYFVPGAKGTTALSRFAENGIVLRVLTNSLAATDVGLVHSGYAKRRKPLLRSHVKIYELKPDLGVASRPEHAATGSSSASLHAKTFSVDRTRAFVGSFNLDPRSIRLNTEMGFVIESASLAETIASEFDKAVEYAAYEVVLDANGRQLEWLEPTPRGEVRWHTEPETGFLKRLRIGATGFLPIEGLL